MCLFRDMMSDYFCNIADVQVLRSQAGFAVKRGEK